MTYYPLSNDATLEEINDFLVELKKQITYQKSVQFELEKLKSSQIIEEVKRIYPESSFMSSDQDYFTPKATKESFKREALSTGYFSPQYKAELDTPLQFIADTTDTPDLIEVANIASPSPQIEYNEPLKLKKRSRLFFRCISHTDACE